MARISLTFCNLLDSVGLFAVQSGVDDVRLESGALHENAVVEHGLVQGALNLDVHHHRRLQVVAPLQADIGLHDGHETLGLADEGVPREVVHVGLDGEGGRLARRDVDHEGASPLCELGARLGVLRAPHREGVEALHDGRPALAGELVDLQVGLHAGNDAEGAELLREEGPVGGRALVQSLGIKDGSAQVVVRALRLEEHLAVGPPRLLGVLQPDRLEPAADRAGPLVTRRDALPGRGDERGDPLELGLVRGGEVSAAVARLQPGADPLRGRPTYRRGRSTASLGRGRSQS